MLCKRCQTELPPGERFCPTCGSLQPMICPSCGSESRPGSRTCSNCGKKLPVVERENKLVYTRRVKRPSELIATAAITPGALMILGGAIFFLSKSIDFGKKPVQVSGDVQQEEQMQSPEELPPLIIETPEEPAVSPEETDLPEQPPVEEEQPAENEQPAEEEQPAEDEQPAEEEPPVEDADTDSEWIFPDSSERLLTDADIAGLSAWDLKVARNEIYARHGRRFNSAELQNHFNSCSWYSGTVAPGDFTDSMLSATELANVQFLKAAE